MTQDITAQLKNHSYMSLHLSVALSTEYRTEPTAGTDRLAFLPGLAPTPVLSEWTNTFD